MTEVAERLGDLYRSAGLIFGGLILGKVLALLAETVIVRSLAPSEYGHLALAYTIVVISGRLAVVGVKDGVTRLVSGEDEYRSRYELFHHGILIVFATGTIVTTILFFGRDILGEVMDDPQLSLYLIFFCPFVILYSLSRVTFAMLRTEGKSLYAVLSRDLIGRVIPISILVIGLYYNIEEVGALLYWISIPFVLGVTSSIFLHKNYPLDEFSSISVRYSTLKQIWSFSWPLAASSSIFVFLSYFDILMIGFFLSSDSVGYYRAIQPLQEVSTLLLTSFTFLFLPIATQFYEENNTEGLNQFYTSSTKWMAAGSFPIILVFGLFADDVVRIFFGSAYLPAAPALSLLVLGLFTRIIVGLDGDVTKAIDRPKIELYSAFTGLIANFVLNLLLIPRIGIIGAAAGTVIGYAVYNGIEVLAIYNLTGIHPFSLNNFKPILLTGLFSIVVWRITRGIEIGLLGLVFFAVVISIVQLLSILFSNSLDSTDIILIEHLEDQIGVDLTRLKLYLD